MVVVVLNNRHLELCQWEEAYRVASLGVTEADWRTLAMQVGTTHQPLPEGLPAWLDDSQPAPCCLPVGVLSSSVVARAAAGRGPPCLHPPEGRQVARPGAQPRTEEEGARQRTAAPAAAPRIRTVSRWSLLPLLLLEVVVCLS